MSLFGIASATNDLDHIRATADKKLGDQLLVATGALIKWIPAEVIAGYGAAVVMNQAAGGSVDALTWWIALGATPIFLVLFAVWQKNYDKLVRKLVLSVPAFVLWSASVPFGAWNLWDLFAKNVPAVLFGLLIVTIGFSLLAEIIVRDKKS